MMGLFESEAVLTQELSRTGHQREHGGCLVESLRWIEVGTIGTLQVKLGTEECTDDVEVVRCDMIMGAQPSTTSASVVEDETAPGRLDPPRRRTLRHQSGSAGKRPRDVAPVRASRNCPPRLTRDPWRAAASSDVVTCLPLRHVRAANSTKLN